MKIPVFVSCPTDLNKTQQASRNIIMSILDDLNLEPRALGRSDFPDDLPLREVHVIARHCSGGIILGFTQFSAPAGGTRKPGTGRSRKVSGPVVFPTEWNHLEAGILFSLGLPLLVFREDGISGGIFDPGVTDVFVQQMPKGRKGQDDLKDVFLKWRGRVSDHYYTPPKWMSRG